MTHRQYRFISEQEFDRDWKPRLKANGELFRHEELDHFSIRHVWTIYEDGAIDEDGYSDNSWFATPGVVAGHALGYVITERPWDIETKDAIWYADDDEDASEERRQFHFENEA